MRPFPLCSYYGGCLLLNCVSKYPNIPNSWQRIGIQLSVYVTCIRIINTQSLAKALELVFDYHDLSLPWGAALPSARILSISAIIKAWPIALNRLLLVTLLLCVLHQVADLQKGKVCQPLPLLVHIPQTQSRVPWYCLPFRVTHVS